MAKRRTPGSGYTRQEKNSTWTALYPKHPASGYHVKRGFASEAAAARWLAELNARKAARYDIAGGEQSLETLIDRWLDRQEERVKAGKLKQRTWNDYDFKLGYARDLLGSRRISDLMPDHIDDAMSMISKALAETTTRQIRALLHRILEDARQRRYIESNPVIVERGIAAARQEPKRLNVTETRAVLRAAAGSFYELAWWLIFTLGLRAGEVCGLRRSDIDLDARTVRVEETVSDLRGKPVRSTPKTKNSTRLLPLPRDLMPMVRDHLAWLDRRAAEGLRRGQWQSSARLFPGRGGRPFNTTSLYHQLQRLCGQARVVRTKVHDARHTAAKFYADVGAPDAVLKPLLGHSVGITGHYAAVDAEAMRPWAEQVYGALVGGSAKQERKEG